MQDCGLQGQGLDTVCICLGKKECFLCSCVIKSKDESIFITNHHQNLEVDSNAFTFMFLCLLSKYLMNN